MAENLQLHHLHVPIREKLLINGYIRDIEKINLNQIIPYSVNMICIDYFHSLRLIYHLADGLNTGFHVVNIDQTTSYIYNITTFNKNTSKSLYIAWNAAMYLQKNFKIPQQINENIRDMISDDFSFSKSNEYDVIFKCGGSVDQFNGTTYCSAFILSPIIPSLPEQLSFNWELPRYPQPMECHSILYSEKHGLLSVGNFALRKERLFYRLSFDNFGTKNDWKWEEMPYTKDKRPWTSTVLIGDNQLLAVGGYDTNVGALNTVEMFDFEENEWKYDYIKNIKHKRYREGILFDKENERIFLSGGKSAERCTEWYDFRKNKWFDDIVQYQYPIDFYPILQKERKNILYIASQTANCVQWLDLRENKKWNVIYGGDRKQNNRNSHSFADLFGIQCKAFRSATTRLLG